MQNAELVLFVGFISGLIGHSGSQLGRYIGRRKHSLFGLRPVRTADLLATLAGSLIGLASLAIWLLVQFVPTASELWRGV